MSTHGESIITALMYELEVMAGFIVLKLGANDPEVQEVIEDAAKVYSKALMRSTSAPEVSATADAEALQPYVLPAIAEREAFVRRAAEIGLPAAAREYAEAMADSEGGEPE